MRRPVDPHQYTLKEVIKCHGVGLHSGKTVNLAIKPAPLNSGIRFLRSDLCGNRAINAHMDKVVDTRLATTIGEDDVRISTTEHLMAALQGCGIDNVDIELDGCEVPIMDGSAAPFVKLLRETGKTRQGGYRKALRITKQISYSDGNSKITITPYNGFKITGEISFDDQLIKSQKYSVDLDTQRFIDEICQARTFGYVEQVEELWAKGLALGGTLENVIAIHWNRDSILNEDGLRFDDEFIRHKVLDLIGDLALMGCPILGHVSAQKTGHTQHLGFMQTIANSPESWELVELNNTGAHSVLQRVVSNTKAAGDFIMPFFKGSHFHPYPVTQ